MAGSGRALAAAVMAVVIVAVACSVVGVGGVDQALVNKCSGEVGKVSECLSYSTGKADAPTKACCAAVSEIRGTDPACLCLFIQQVHDGTGGAKSLGILESRLLLLPSACAIKNASISDCPSLLGIPPNSTDAAIFTNASSSPTAAPAAPSGMALPDTNGVARANPHPLCVSAFLAIALAVFLCAFPAGPGPEFSG